MAGFADLVEDAPHSTIRISLRKFLLIRTTALEWNALCPVRILNLFTLGGAEIFGPVRNAKNDVIPIAKLG